MFRINARNVDVTRLWIHRDLMAVWRAGPCNHANLLVGRRIEDHDVLAAELTHIDPVANHPEAQHFWIGQEVQMRSSLIQDLHPADAIGHRLQEVSRNLPRYDSVLAGISDLLAPDGTFIHPRAAERTKSCSAYNRPAPEAVTSAHADVEPTGAAAFRAFLRHRSTLVPFLRQPSLHSAARQPAGTGSAQILRSISPKSRRFR